MSLRIRDFRPNYYLVHDRLVIWKEITDRMSPLPIALLSPHGHFPAHDQV